jgi:hypothetical protein
MRMALLILAMVFRYGLKPGKSRGVRSLGRIPSGQRVFAGSSGLEAFLREPDSFFDVDGILHLYIEQCPVLAAPLLLFFLKRQGYSGCRAVSRDNVLEIHASR